MRCFVPSLPSTSPPALVLRQPARPSSDWWCPTFDVIMSMMARLYLIRERILQILIVMIIIIVRLYIEWSVFGSRSSRGIRTFCPPLLSASFLTRHATIEEAIDLRPFYSQLDEWSKPRGKSDGVRPGGMAHYLETREPVISTNYLWIESAHPSLSELKQAFDMFDENNDGKISCEELSGVLRTLGHDHSQAEIADMIKHADVNENGYVEYDEFLLLMKRWSLHGSEPSEAAVDEEEDKTKETFKVFDMDGNGFIDQHELRYIMKRLGENLGEDDVREMFRLADLNGDGLIDYEEFQKLLGGLGGGFGGAGGPPSSSASSSCPSSSASSGGKHTPKSSKGSSKDGKKK
ncbi:hypothetical protein RRG08_060028 [Elysia crispata]|uniref:EF-hand domain-containing protein n=1 Tax=Elysia crispata TaxID=231223 RepID=A0AAE1CX75_9GAST|nr:hypothetical protein RRG08_060028 [Elysia crispata]